MLRILNNNRAQVVAGEYVVVFFIVATAMGVMTVYLTRAFQARVFDARDTMVNVVATRTASYYNGNVYKGYEPYYLNKETDVAQTVLERTVLENDALGPGSAGTFTRTIDNETRLWVTSTTLPPKDAN